MQLPRLHSKLMQTFSLRIQCFPLRRKKSSQKIFIPANNWLDNYLNQPVGCHIKLKYRTILWGQRSNETSASLTSHCHYDIPWRSNVFLTFKTRIHLESPSRFKNPWNELGKPQLSIKKPRPLLGNHRLDSENPRLYWAILALTR